jgi:hypothetical protein
MAADIAFSVIISFFIVLQIKFALAPHSRRNWHAKEAGKCETMPPQWIGQGWGDFQLIAILPQRIDDEDTEGIIEECFRFDQ